MFEEVKETKETKEIKESKDVTNNTVSFEIGDAAQFKRIVHGLFFVSRIVVISCKSYDHFVLQAVDCRQVEVAQFRFKPCRILKAIVTQLPFRERVGCDELSMFLKSKSCTSKDTISIDQDSKTKKLTFKVNKHVPVENSSKTKKLTIKSKNVQKKQNKKRKRDELESTPPPTELVLQPITDKDIADFIPLHDELPSAENSYILKNWISAELGFLFSDLAIISPKFMLDIVPRTNKIQFYGLSFHGNIHLRASGHKVKSKLTQRYQGVYTVNNQKRIEKCMGVWRTVDMIIQPNRPIIITQQDSGTQMIIHIAERVLDEDEKAQFGIGSVKGLFLKT